MSSCFFFFFFFFFFSFSFFSSPSSSSPSPSSSSFQPICPNDSKFFACTSGTKFIGCCATTLNPCNPSSFCAPSDLKAASFSADAYGTFPDQECPAGSLWYTCKETSPPFWGCCDVDACAEGGCVGGVGGNLSAALLSSNPSVAAAFLSMVGSSYSISTSTSALAATTCLIARICVIAPSSSSVAVNITVTTAATTITATTTTTSSGSSENTTSNTGAIVAGTVAGVAVVLGFILVLFFLHPRRRAAVTATTAATPTAAAPTAAAAANSGGGGGSGGSSSGPNQESPSSMLDNNRDIHPALRKPTISPVAAVERQRSRQSIPMMGESQIAAYRPQRYRQTLPPPAFPIHSLLNRSPPMRPPPPPPPSRSPPPPPSCNISELDGTPVFTSSPVSNTFPSTPPTRAYSAGSELASFERDTSAEMESDSPTKPAGRREMEEKNKGKRIMSAN